MSEHHTPAPRAHQDEADGFVPFVRRNWRSLDFTGQRCGRLVPLGLRPEAPGARSASNLVWVCRCDCGRLTAVASNKLRSGRTRSCGCLAAEMTADRMRTHGLRHSPEYGHWRKMLERCNDSRCPEYQNYGAKGVRVCERWLSFENFYADMGARPSPKHTLDRYPNGGGNYEPGNVRWATRTEQSRNRRNVKPIVAFGLSLLIPEWSERTSISPETIRARLKRGWGPEEAVGLPCGSRRPS